MLMTEEELTNLKLIYILMLDNIIVKIDNLCSDLRLFSESAQQQQ